MGIIGHDARSRQHDRSAQMGLLSPATGAGDARSGIARTLAVHHRIGPGDVICGSDLLDREAGDRRDAARESPARKIWVTRVPGSREHGGRDGPSGRSSFGGSRGFGHPADPQRSVPSLVPVTGREVQAQAVRGLVTRPDPVGWARRAPTMARVHERVSGPFVDGQPEERAAGRVGILIGETSHERDHSPRFGCPLDLPRERSGQQMPAAATWIGRSWCVPATTLAD
jgi:hypothetical protein